MTLEPVKYISENRRVLLSANPTDKDTRSRMSQYVDWLDTQGRVWFAPDLAAYRDYLLERLNPASVKAHLSTIRGQYKHLLLERDLFYAFVPPNATPADAKAIVDEIITRLENAISPFHAPVATIEKQDVAESEHLRLTKEQAQALIRRPFQVHGESSSLALRDAALIALMLATGLREDEICSLEVDDLRQRLGGELALRVRQGKYNKQRLVPYGVNSGVLDLVQRWLDRAGISEGRVFRAFESRACDARRLRLDMTTRSLQNILKEYPIYIEGVLRAVKPHDLRRTYARREFEAGTPLVAIQQNLGHANLQTTMTYIGELNAAQRQSRAAYDWQDLIPQELV